MADNDNPAAVEQCVEFLQPVLEDYSRQYSVRGILVTLGYKPERIEEILRYIADRGFNYCLDPSIAHNGVYPGYGPCCWNPDQLHSRLRCV